MKMRELRRERHVEIEIEFDIDLEEQATALVELGAYALEKGLLLAQASVASDPYGNDTVLLSAILRR